MPFINHKEMYNKITACETLINKKGIKLSGYNR